MAASSEFARQLGLALLENTSIYLLSTVPLFLIFWVLWKPAFAPRIQPQVALQRRQAMHDLLRSSSTLVLVALADVWLYALQGKGHTAVYSDPRRYGLPWLVLSAPLILFLDDAFVYFTHRGMHHPALFRRVHRAHHDSTNPTPFTSLAFQPAEALVQNVLFYVLPLVLPLHVSVIAIWQIFGVLNNVLAHLGHELYPAGWTRFPFLRHKTTSTHHDMHHAHFDGNYGLYFTWWDRWLGTEFPNYVERHRTLFTHPTGHGGQAPARAPEAQTGCQVEVEWQGASQSFLADPAQTLLASALAAGVALPHSCQRGACGTCEVECVQGTVLLPDQSLASAQPATGLRVRSCQVRPRSATLVVRASPRRPHRA